MPKFPNRAQKLCHRTVDQQEAEQPATDGGAVMGVVEGHKGAKGTKGARLSVLESLKGETPESEFWSVWCSSAIAAASGCSVGWKTRKRPIKSCAVECHSSHSGCLEMPIGVRPPSFVSTSLCVHARGVHAWCVRLL